MKLKELCQAAALECPGSDAETEISAIAMDSGRVTKGSLFVCIRGLHTDGHTYIGEAIAKGAVAVLCETGREPAQIPTVYSDNPRRAAARLYNAFWGNPVASLKFIGVTGTNGKTTVTHMLRAILESSMYRTGLIGTVGCESCGRHLAAQNRDPLANMTTPDPPDLYRMLREMVDDGVEYVLVFKLSRFGRNAADVLNNLQIMQDFGVNLICVEDGIDSSKDAGKLMISVLSAVAEIERENIRTQTMAGREQKAREGKWNGGFAPYGYKLENGNLVIAEDEVEVIRVIYDRYIHTNEGVAGVAKYLNRNGFIKKLRQNNTISGFSRNFVQDVLDNPVYMGKIAYGRRRTEKKQGTRNEMHVVEQSEFPVYEGQHEAIVSEEDWYLAQEKRKINSFKREKVNNPDHAHILSGILKCPCCGKSMYGNIAKAHSKDKKTRYYYYCKNTVTPTGHECSFRLNIEQTEINKFVAKVISAMVSNPRFIEAIQAKIGTAVDTEDMEKQIAVLQGQLKQAFGTKSRLERQMDTLDINDAHYDRKILDLQRRYDEQYDTIEEIEVQIGELQSQIRSIQQEKISGDNIYRLLLAFDEVYHSATEAEQKEFMKAFIERIEMFPEKRKDGSWIKKIVFNFPVPVDGEEVKELPLETETTVETVCLLSKLK